VAIAAIEQGSGAARTLRVTLAALRHHPLAALIGALVGGTLIATAAVRGHGVTGWLLAAAGLVLATVGAAAAEAVAAVQSALHTIPKNGFGLCSGLPPVEGEGPSALTPWLFEELQSICGRGPGDPPLTFGDLEGKGIKLAMPDAVVSAMSARGRCAGEALVRDFDFDNHRWIRFRSFMELFEDMLPQIRTAFTAEPSDARAYDDLIDDPPSYRKGWSEARRAYFRSRTGHVIDLSLNWPDPDGRHSFDNEAPKPTAVLRVTPVV